MISSYECEHPCCTDKIIIGNAIIVLDRWALHPGPKIWGVKEDIFNLPFCQEFFYFLFLIWKSEFLVKRHKSSIVQLALLRQGWNFLLDLLLDIPLAQLGGNLIVLLFQLLFLFRKLAFIFWQILLKVDILGIFMT